MGAMKDIYDIFADVASKVEARRLQQRESRSREEAITYATSLEVCVFELQAKVKQLDREHAEEVAELKAENAQLVATNAQIIAKITELETPNVPTSFNRVGTPDGW
jgi:cell division protein FtsB